MRGTHDRHGNITITFNSQSELLEAPDGKSYLPCDACGAVLQVPRGVVSACCERIESNARPYVVCGAERRLAAVHCALADAVVHDMVTPFVDDERTALYANCHTVGCLCGSDAEGPFSLVTDERELADYWRGMSQMAAEAMEG